MSFKIISHSAAANLITSNDTVAIAGFVGVGVPDEFLAAIETRYRKIQAPNDLTLLFVAAPGTARTAGRTAWPTMS